MIRLPRALVLAIMLAQPAWAFVDLNTATQSELESLKGIGPTKAQAIIEYRRLNGPFKRVEDLEKVKGIGEATVEKLRDQVTVSPPARPSRPTSATPRRDRPR